MREYELMYLLTPELPEDEMTAATERVSSLITNRGGEITKVDTWGRRRLAYPIRRHSDGYYTVLRFNLEPGQTVELERNLRLTEPGAPPHHRARRRRPSAEDDQTGACAGRFDETNAGQRTSRCDGPRRQKRRRRCRKSEPLWRKSRKRRPVQRPWRRSRKRRPVQSRGGRAGARSGGHGSNDQTCASAGRDEGVTRWTCARRR